MDLSPVEATEQIESLKKQLRVSRVMGESDLLPEPFAPTHMPIMSPKELSHLENLTYDPKEKKSASYKYRAKNPEYRSEYRNDKNRDRQRQSNRSEPFWLKKIGTATELAFQALKDGKGYTTIAEATVAQLRRREKVEEEKWLVAAVARLEMIGVQKNRKTANNLVEVMQEWVEDAKVLAKLHDDHAMFSVVSNFEEYEEEEKNGEEVEEKKDEDEGKKEEEEEKKEEVMEKKEEVVKKEDGKKKNNKKKNKNKKKKSDEKTKMVEVEEKKEEVKKEEEKIEEKKINRKKLISLSISTRFNGTEYDITVELSNESVVRVKHCSSHLRGIEEKITKIVAEQTLLHAITGEFWGRIERAEEEGMKTVG